MLTYYLVTKITPFLKGENLKYQHSSKVCTPIISPLYLAAYGLPLVIGAPPQKYGDSDYYRKWSISRLIFKAYLSYPKTHVLFSKDFMQAKATHPVTQTEHKSPTQELNLLKEDIKSPDYLLHSLKRKNSFSTQPPTKARFGWAQ